MKGFTMAILPKSLIRPVALQKIPDMIKQGLSPTGIINQLKGQALSYRRTVMLADIRSMMGIEAKKDTAKYVRRDRMPTMRSIADVEWEMSDEYMYKVKVHTQLKPDEPLGERFVNIMSDHLMTPQQVQEEVFERWGTWEKYAGEKPMRVTLESIMHRVPMFELPEE